MLRTLIILLLLSTVALAQTNGAAPSATPEAKADQGAAAASPSPSTKSGESDAKSTGETSAKSAQGAVSSQKPAEAAQVPATEAVVTIHGLCPAAAGTATKKGASPAAGCTTKITKAQFDRLVQAINTNNQPLPPNARRSIAQRYTELLAFANAAEKAGVEKDPRFAERLRIQRLSTLAEFYRISLEEKYRNPPQAEIDAYYKEHQADFQQAKLRRIYIPKTDLSGKSNTPEQRTAFQNKAEQLAKDIQERAAKGEDVDKLQKEVYSTLGMTSNPPNTDIGNVRKGALKPEDEKAIFALNPGGVYKSDEASAIVIYKLESKDTVPKEAAKDEISRTLFRQKMEARMKEITGSAKPDFNDKYFGPAAPAAPLQGPPGAASPH